MNPLPDSSRGNEALTSTLKFRFHIPHLLSNFAKRLGVPIRRESSGAFMLARGAGARTSLPAAPFAASNTASQFRVHAANLT